jgi:hypothetical protein
MQINLTVLCQRVIPSILIMREVCGVSELTAKEFNKA